MAPSKEQFGKNHFLAQLEQHQDELRALGVQRCGLFGSFVRGQETSTSDVDVLVEFSKGKKSFDNFMRLADLLERLFQRRVDLVTEASLSPYIGPHILREVEYVPLDA